MNEKISLKLKQLPDKPGTYQMRDKSGLIIYVGKAKNLKKRVSSYFVGAHDEKTTRLVQDIDDFTYIITTNEKEAFLLELAQIKKHIPKYNIKLVSDSTYPYIEVTNERHPIIRTTRDIKGKKGNIFGPYPNAFYANETVKLLDTIFPFRKCSKFPKKVCLYYHIKQCLGPCEYEVSEETYKDLIRKVRSFLSGNTKEFIDEYQEKMSYHSSRLEFEKAQEYKDLIIAINKTTEQQQVIFNDNLDRDVINFVTYDNYMSINILFMRNGKLLFSKSKIFSYYGTEEEVLLTYLAQFYEQNPLPKEILLPHGYNYDLFPDILGDIIFTPQRGRKVKLLEIATKNALEHMNNNLPVFLNKEKKTIGALRELEEVLGIDFIKRIDIFDNSSISGHNLVSAMVVFTNGLPDKNEYRKYKIKTLDTPDDYRMMKEIIYRRYQAVLMDGLEKPDLVVVDGGLIQLRAAKEVLKDLNLFIPVIGLKKNDRHKTESIITQDEKEIILDKHSNLYSLCYKMQEEVHRFAISFQRNIANKSIYGSILDTIPKVGPATKNKLLKKYKNLENIKKAPREELRALKIQEEAIDNIYMALKQIQKE
ncbi:MAG: excinuclease ABC subunit UvrC [Candidatus Izemoplasmatales bacterium]|nr:excinuclease ABC subunit UvrC [Candidatus Izemoplasmatales bacterium]MDY0138459.1 excinuclease ABC subunit UvrC [Candidatus Izemoplasmatales bacterium]